MQIHGAGGPGWRVSESFGVRHAGLPASVLDELRFAESFALLENLLRQRRACADEGGALADALHPVIGALDDATLRPRLIGLRRALFRCRRPAGAELSDVVRAALPAGLTGRIDAWLTELDRAGELAAALPGALAAEQADRLAAMRKCAHDPLFRRALSQAGPALFAELDKWLADEHRVPRPRTVLGLTNFLSRAAAKTSPYSSFAVCGRGEWTGGHGPAGPEGSAATGVLELHGMIERGVVLELAARPEHADRMRVRVNPSLRDDGERLEFLGTGEQEPIVGMRPTPAIRACLELAAGEPTLAGLRGTLGGDVPEASEAAGRMLAKLLGVGLLELRPPVPDQSMDALGELADWLGAADPAHLLRRLRDALRADIGLTDVAGHVARQRELHGAVDALSTALGIDTDADGPRKAAFHENAVYRGTVLRHSAPAWRGALSDVDAFRRWFASTDPTLPLRLALGAYLEQRFGAGAEVPYLVFHRATYEVLKGEEAGLPAEIRDYFDITTPCDLAGSALPRVRELHSLREAARNVLRAAPGADGVVRVDPDRLRALAAGWPSWIAAPRSLACYVQVLVDDPVELVINLATPGYGRGRSRLFRLIGAATGTEVPMRTRRGEPVLAEIGGTFTSTVNRRIATAPYEIDYPGTVSARQADERIPLADLVVRRDPDTGEATVHSRRLGTRIHPAHLGMMAEFLLPPAARLLAIAFGDTFLLHPSLPLLDTVADSVTVTQGVRHTPRLAVGRVVVQRARWTANAADVPVAQDAAGWAELVEWLRANGIPQRCYVRVWGGGPADDAKLQRWVLGKSRKPIHVDVASWFQVRALGHLLAGGGEVVIFEEALPDPAGLAPGERVTELLVEISESADGTAEKEGER